MQGDLCELSLNLSHKCCKAHRTLSSDLLTELKRRYKHPESEPAGDTSLLNLGPNAPQNPASTSGPDSSFVVDENTEILLQQIFGSGSNQDVGVMDTDGQLPHDLSILGAAPSNFK